MLRNKKHLLRRISVFLFPCIILAIFIILMEIDTQYVIVAGSIVNVRNKLAAWQLYRD